MQQDNTAEWETLNFLKHNTADPGDPVFLKHNTADHSIKCNPLK